MKKLIELEKARIQAGYGKREMDELFGYKPRTVQFWETGYVVPTPEEKNEYLERVKALPKVVEINEIPKGIELPQAYKRFLVYKDGKYVRSFAMFRKTEKIFEQKRNGDDSILIIDSVLVGVSFDNKYKEARIRTGYTVSEIEEQTHIPNMNMVQWEKGDTGCPKGTSFLYMWWLKQHDGVILTCEQITEEMVKALPKQHQRFAVLYPKDEGYGYILSFGRIEKQEVISNVREASHDKAGERRIIIDTESIGRKSAIQNIE